MVPGLGIQHDMGGGKVWWLLRAAMCCHQGTGALGLVAGVFSLGKWFFPTSSCSRDFEPHGLGRNRL